jgi:tellurite resistance protein TerC
MWGGFTIFVVVMLLLDLGVFHRHAHAVSWQEAVSWSAVWIGLSCVFCGALYVWFGSERALEFAAGFVIEKALAVDNLFVFIVIFRAFAIPLNEQHRVLFWGVFGALVMRAAFIFAGAAVLERFHWAMYGFGGFLVIAGVRLFFQKDHGNEHPEKSAALRFFARVMPATHELAGDRFTVVKDGRRYATPLLLALVAIELSDVIFAVDSIPAIFAVTTDRFLVFTSNIFAIMGLRSLFFLLAGVLDKFVYLKPALAFVLAFVGVKMLIVDVYKVPILASLGAILGILAIAIIASMVKESGAAVAHTTGAASPAAGELSEPTSPRDERTEHKPRERKA